VEPTVRRSVDIHATRAKKFDRFLARGIRPPNRQDLAATAVDARANTEMLHLIFFQHLLDTRAGGDVSLMNQSIKQLCGTLDDA
jgi:hypothetical protein